MAKIKEFECTDPDNLQFCKVQQDGAFTYREWDSSVTSFLPKLEELSEEMFNNYEYWHSVTLYYEDLTETDIQEAISPYYKSLEEVKELYGDSYKQIVVECFFEQNYTSYKC